MRNKVGDITARDPRQLFVTLRKDLHVAIQYYQGKPCYVLEDPQTVQFFRVGIPEGTFISMLDGKTSLDEALGRSAIDLGKDAFSEAEAVQIIYWLLESNLAYPSGTISAQSQNEDVTAPNRRGFNPLAIRIPLARPDRLFNSAAPWCDWMFEPTAIGVWCCAVAVAIGELLISWSHFTKDLQNVVAPRNWLSLFVIWILLKAAHEFAHGAVCKKFGGVVTETGAMILWGMPVPYVDVTSAWGFRSKKQRIFAAIAGVYVETFIAAFAALVWSNVEKGWLPYFCVHIVFIAGISSVMFNLNPLMRFDGYYALMDWLEIPNLYGAGQQFWTAVKTRVLYGRSVPLPGDSPRQRHLIACYGLLSGLWRVVVYLTLIILAFAALPINESQIIWAILASVVAYSVWKLRKKKNSPSPFDASARSRAIIIRCAGLGLIAVALFCLASPFRLSTPGIVEYEPFQAIRNASPGFVESVRVRWGETVEAGQVIAVLVNKDLEYELADANCEVEMSKLALRAAQKKNDLGAAKAEQEKLASLENKLAEKRDRIARLTVTAPSAGVVVSRQLESLEGKYLAVGSELVLLGDESRKEVRAAVDQDDADDFLDQVGRPVWIRAGNRVFSSSLTQLEPRASVDPIHPALSAAKGGPLPVRRKPLKSSDKSEDSDKTEFELISPQFAGQIVLSVEQSEQVNAGQRVQVSFAPKGESLGDYLFDKVQRWCRDKVRRVRSYWAS